MTIRTLNKNETALALKLSWNVFQIYEAPQFSPEGVEDFKKFLESEEAISQLQFYGAWKKSRLTGIIALRGKHISLFFVANGQLNKGIGRQLFDYAKKYTASKKFTVNSSPYAVDIYKKMGFKTISDEQLTNGIRYTPMTFTYLQNLT